MSRGRGFDNARGITGNTYDALNRVTSITDPIGNMAQTEYDANGNISDIQSGNGFEHKKWCHKNTRDDYIVSIRKGAT